MSRWTPAARWRSPHRRPRSPGSRRTDDDDFRPPDDDGLCCSVYESDGALSTLHIDLPRTAVAWSMSEDGGRCPAEPKIRVKSGERDAPGLVDRIGTEATFCSAGAVRPGTRTFYPGVPPLAHSHGSLLWRLASRGR